MIRLNNQRGLEDIQSWDDIINLVGYTPSLDPKTDKLYEVIGKYIIQEKINCGLVGCHKPHNRGYIVQTISGHVTNIGHVCGKNNFGVEFKELSAKFNRALNETRSRESITSFLLNLDKKRENIDNLLIQENGHDIFVNAMKLTSINKGSPEIIVKHINMMVRNRKSIIETEREATPAERESYEVATGKKPPKSYLIPQIIGSLGGLDFLYDENNLKKILINNLQVNINVLEKLNPDTLPYKELQHWGKWCNSFDREIDKCKAILKMGKQLMTHKNLTQLCDIIPNEKDKTMFLALLSSFKM